LAGTKKKEGTSEGTHKKKGTLEGTLERTLEGTLEGTTAVQWYGRGGYIRAAKEVI
jgi:hypothetical protein